jgi:ABC-type spermidine/putrescine transport system permease subunit II
MHGLFPGILVGVGVLFLFAALGLNNTFLGLVLAHSALATPFVVITLAAGLTQVDLRDGGAKPAPPMRVLLSVAFPGIRTSIATAALFAFLLPFD